MTAASDVPVPARETVGRGDLGGYTADQEEFGTPHTMFRSAFHRIGRPRVNFGRYAELGMGPVRLPEQICTEEAAA